MKFQFKHFVLALAAIAPAAFAAVPAEEGKIVAHELIEIQGKVSEVRIAQGGMVAVHTPWVSPYAPDRTDRVVRVEAYAAEGLAANVIGYKTTCGTVETVCCVEGSCGKTREVRQCQYQCDTVTYFKACLQKSAGSVNVVVTDNRAPRRRSVWGATSQKVSVE